MGTLTKVADKADLLFGQIALANKMVTEAQLRECLEIQKGLPQRKPLGVLLLEKGYLQEADLQRIIDFQRKKLADQVLQAKQKKEDTLFGKVLVQLGMASEKQVDEAVILQSQQKPGHKMRIGDILVRKGTISRAQLKTALEHQAGLIFACPGCQTQYNVVMFNPGSSLVCYQCGSGLRIPPRKVPSPHPSDGFTIDGLPSYD